jgi:hypothetical protein
MGIRILRARSIFSGHTLVVWVGVELIRTAIDLIRRGERIRARTGKMIANMCLYPPAWF